MDSPPSLDDGPQTVAEVLYELGHIRPISLKAVMSNTSVPAPQARYSLQLAREGELVESHRVNGTTLLSSSSLRFTLTVRGEEYLREHHPVFEEEP